MQAGPLSISLQGVGKQFYRQWLFRGIDLNLTAGESLAVIGTNGSGKSTFLRILAGQMAPSEGAVSFSTGNHRVPATERYRYLSWAAPYLSLFPDLSFIEHVRLQKRFTNHLVSELDAISLLELKGHEDKPLRYFSSGMLQRTKVGLALFQDTPLLLLDEPTSNMDDYFAGMMLGLLGQFRRDRTLVLASNLPREYGDIPRQLHLGERRMV